MFVKAEGNGRHGPPGALETFRIEIDKHQHSKRTLLGAPGIATRNPGIATQSLVLNHQMNQKLVLSEYPLSILSL